MPAGARHLSAAAHNKQLARNLLASLEPEWAAVLAFYSALHQVDAYFAQIALHPLNHEMRKSYIQRTGQLRQIYADYRTLESRSRDARYDLVRISPSAVQQLIDNELEAIEGVVQRLLRA